MPAGRVRETKTMVEDRLRVKLDYPDGACDLFEWQTFTETAMAGFAARAGLTLLRAFSDFDPASPPNAGKPKVQFLLGI